MYPCSASLPSNQIEYTQLQYLTQNSTPQQHTSSKADTAAGVPSDDRRWGVGRERLHRSMYAQPVRGVSPLARAYRSPHPWPHHTPRVGSRHAPLPMAAPQPGACGTNAAAAARLRGREDGGRRLAGGHPPPCRERGLCQLPRRPWPAPGRPSGPASSAHTYAWSAQPRGRLGRAPHHEHCLRPRNYRLLKNLRALPTVPAFSFSARTLAALTRI